MSNLLNSENFGSKIYGRFPSKYREDDADVNFALKRYIESLSDGGFKYAIDEINGITDIIDPSKTQSEALPILFKQFGLEIFNGIPEIYLRHLLPKLGEAWSKKGSLSVVEFITASLTGIKTSSFVEYDKEENPTVGVRLEMDYNIGDYFPKAHQFSRLLKNFVPFYCNLNLIYSYLFDEGGSVHGEDYGFELNITDVKQEGAEVKTEDKEVKSVNILSDDLIGMFVPRVNSATNRLNNTLNESFYTNALYSYDIIRRNDGSTEIVF